MVWAYVLIFGFAMGGVIVLLPLVVGHFFGLVSFGVILGTLGLTQALGGSVGAIFSGLLYDHWGSYHYALIVFSCVYLIAIITTFLAGKSEPYNGASRSVKSQKKNTNNQANATLKLRN